MTTYIREGKPSASAMPRYFLCAGAWQAEQRAVAAGLAVHDGDAEDAKSGTRIHEAVTSILSGSKPEDTALIELNAETEVETAVMCLKDARQHIAQWEELYASEPPTIRVEERRWLHDGLDKILSGQFDTLVTSGKRGLLIDFKTGRHEEPHSSANEQLRTLAVLSKQHYGLENVMVTITQPWVSRSIQPCEYDMAALRYSDERLRRRLAYIQTPEAAGDLNPGPEQCRFCKAAGICQVAQKTCRQIVAQDTALTIDDLSPAERVRQYETLKLAERLAKKGQALIKSRLMEDPEYLEGMGLKRGAVRRNLEGTPAEVYKAVSPVLTTEQFAECCTPRLGDLEKAYINAYAEQEGNKKGAKALGKEAFVNVMARAGLVNTSENAPTITPKDKIKDGQEWAPAITDQPQPEMQEAA